MALSKNPIRGSWMKPFAQKQNQPATRWLVFIGVVAAGFGVWFFDLLPELRPVPAGQLAVESEDAVPIPADSWDDSVYGTDQPESPKAEEFDSLLNAIDEDVDPLDRVLTELSEPDIADEPSFSNERLTETMDDSDGPIRPTSFDAASRSAADGSRHISGTGVVPAVALRPAAPILSAETAEALRRADLLMRQDKTVEAHNVLSNLYWKQPEVRSVLERRIMSTAAEIFSDPHRHFGAPYLVQPGDTLESIGQNHRIPWQYLAQLNRISPSELQAGQQLKVMRGPFSAIVDLSRFELTIHAHGYFVHRYDIGIGADDKTPIGEFTVQEKIENPTWYDPDGGQIDKDDPQNPLGEYWIGLGEHIGIHGTIDPQSIGSARSRGCVHMLDDDIAEVFALLGRGSTVRIRP